MCDFPSEEPQNEWKRFLWGGPTVPPFFVGGKRPVGLPNINRGTEIRQGTPPYFESLFDPSTNTPFYLAYKVLPGEAAKLGTHKRPDLKWKVFDNYLQSIDDTNTEAWTIPCLTIKTRSFTKEDGNTIILLLLKFFPQRFLAEVLNPLEASLVAFS